MSENTQIGSEKKNERSDEEEEEIRSLAKKIAHHLGCKVSELKNIEKVNRMLPVLTKQYSREESNTIMIRFAKMGVLTYKQVDDAHELLYGSFIK